MTRIRQLFEKEKVILSFLMGGDPCLEATESMALTMLDAGADILVMGLPFSDPVEQRAGQEAHLRALASGVTSRDLLRLAGRLCAASEAPVLLQTYLNVLFRYGYQAFFAECEKAGVDGLIILDLPWEEKEELNSLSCAHQVALIPQVAPASGDRIKDLTSGARDLVHVLAPPEPAQGRRLAREVAERSGLPVVLGLDLADREAASLLFEFADGILWSGALDLIGRYGSEAEQPVRQALSTIRGAAGRG